jgi:hypothetical protein
MVQSYLHLVAEQPDQPITWEPTMSWGTIIPAGSIVIWESFAIIACAKDFSAFAVEIRILI